MERCTDYPFYVCVRLHKFFVALRRYNIYANIMNVHCLPTWQQYCATVLYTGSLLSNAVIHKRNKYIWNCDYIY